MGRVRAVAVERGLIFGVELARDRVSLQLACTVPPDALTTNDSISLEKKPKTFNSSPEPDAPDLLGLVEGLMREQNNSDRDVTRP